MKVKELISLLLRCDQEAPVTLWNAYHDREDDEVHVSVCRDPNSVFIGTNVVFGEEVLGDDSAGKPDPALDPYIDLLKVFG